MLTYHHLKVDPYLLDLLKYPLCTGYLIQIIILEEEGTIRHFKLTMSYQLQIDNAFNML